MANNQHLELIDLIGLTNAIKMSKKAMNMSVGESYHHWYKINYDLRQIKKNKKPGNLSDYKK